MLETESTANPSEPVSKGDAQYQTKDERYFLHARHEMLEFVPAQAHQFLDVGCGKGQFGRLLKDKNAERNVWGVELHQESAIEAKNVLDKVTIGGVPEALDELPDHHFDCVVFNDILEHIIDPAEVLTIIKTKLKKNGHVVASIPNVREFQTLCKLLFQKQWEYTDSGILDRTHVRFFTESSIRRMFEENGFEIEMMKGINRNWRRLPRILNWLTLGWIRDTMYLQFACRARVK